MLTRREQIDRFVRNLTRTLMRRKDEDAGRVPLSKKPSPEPKQHAPFPKGAYRNLTEK